MTRTLIIGCTKNTVDCGYTLTLFDEDEWKFFKISFDSRMETGQYVSFPKELMKEVSNEKS